jgi:gas vesicle protein
MNLDGIIVGLAVGGIGGAVSSMLTARVMLAVHEERFRALIDRLDRIEKRLDLFSRQR